MAGNPVADALIIDGGRAETDGRAGGPRQQIAENGPRGAAFAYGIGDRIGRGRELPAVKIHTKIFHRFLSRLAVVHGIRLAGGNEDIAHAHLSDRGFAEDGRVFGGLAEPRLDLIPPAGGQFDCPAELAIPDLCARGHHFPIGCLPAQAWTEFGLCLNQARAGRNGTRHFDLGPLLGIPLEDLPFERQLQVPCQRVRRLDFDGMFHGHQPCARLSLGSLPVH